MVTSHLTRTFKHCQPFPSLHGYIPRFCLDSFYLRRTWQHFNKTGSSRQVLELMCGMGRLAIDCSSHGLDKRGLHGRRFGMDGILVFSFFFFCHGPSASWLWLNGVYAGMVYDLSCLEQTQCARSPAR